MSFRVVWGSGVNLGWLSLDWEENWGLGGDQSGKFLFLGIRGVFIYILA